MTNRDIIRAWKDENYRSSLGAAERAALPENPAGLVELSARVGLMNATARSNVALGIRSEQFAASCGLPPLAPRSVAAAPAVGSDA